MRSLIEDFIPIEAVGSESAREKSLWRGHVSTIHLWWARRPLVSCRAAVYGALVPADLFKPANGPIEKHASLARANAAKFFERLCKFPGDQNTISDARLHILGAHADRLTRETSNSVSVEDILAGRAPRPRVLDMFAGGGAIPLEALRLGCESYALDLNPVAHIIELCTLVYPQKYGVPDPNSTGSAEDATWAGLAEEVRHWGKWVQDKVRIEIADQYPPLSDPKAAKTRQKLGKSQFDLPGEDFDLLRQGSLTVEAPSGHLMPVAYLWTRTVICKNPTCGAIVPLVRQTWLCQKKERFVALRSVPVAPLKRVRFDVVESNSQKGLDFDPEAGSKGGNATCPFCGAVADIDYVKNEGWHSRLGQQLLAVVCGRPGDRGKVYLSAEDALPMDFNEETIRSRINSQCTKGGFDVPGEPIANLPPDSAENSLGIRVRPYGLRTWGDLFTARQKLSLLTFVAATRAAFVEIKRSGYSDDHAKALITYLGTAIDREAEDNSSLCRWNATAEKLQGTFGRQALPMVWDFCETNPFGGAVGDWMSIVELQANAIQGACESGRTPAHVSRGSATELPWPDDHFDCVVTDPPYYDNVPYADISDFFYVWLRRSIGDLYPEHFASESTPKKSEAIADAMRHGGSNEKAREAYERMIAQSFREARRVLKPDSPMVVVYAHKTTLGWATLVDALRQAGFTVTEAWPLDTELKSRLRGRDSSALASSIFLVARKREAVETAQYEEQVRPELESVVRERVDSLWDLGISGADLVIACVGAGLRAFTRYKKVEYANGEEVPAQRFLTEVETAVLEAILARLSREVGGNGGRRGLATVDSPTRFYTLWRYTYDSAELDAGEAIIFANGTHVELDGLHGLSQGTRPLVEKKKSKYRLLNYVERGDDAKLGMPSDDGSQASLIDALHRLLWLMERHPSGLSEFLREARPNTEQLRLVAQALAGPALKGGELGEVATGTELAALTKLTANWRSVVEDSSEAGIGPLFKAKSRR